MELIPAIDLMNAKIVRLTRGEAKTAKYYYDEFGTPLEAAQRWYNEGAEKLHIIDLDATFGNGNNYQVIAEIAERFSIFRKINGRRMQIQVGGGIRNFGTAKKLLKMGVNQVILGTVAFNKPEVIKLIQEDRELSAESVIVALDHENGLVKSYGWTKNNIQMETARRGKTFVKKISVVDALEKFTKLGVHHFLITSIAKDGMLSGPDIQTLREAVGLFSNVKIIAAGGIGSLNDLVDLKRIGVDGAVIGKALYEHKFTLREAINKIGA